MIAMYHRQDEIADLFHFPIHLRTTNAIVCSHLYNEHPKIDSVAEMCSNLLT